MNPEASSNPRLKVLITRPILREVIDKLAEQFEVLVHPLDEPMSAELLTKAVGGADGLMPSGVQVGKDIIDAAPQLRVVSNIGVGYDNIDVEACSRRRILVTSTPDVLTEATADLAFALIPATARRVVEGDCYVREGHWSHWRWNFLWGSRCMARR
jgi:gluconate 2-dehydrogenase